MFCRESLRSRIVSRSSGECWLGIRYMDAWRPRPAPHLPRLVSLIHLRPPPCSERLLNFTSDPLFSRNNTVQTADSRCTIAGLLGDYMGGALRFENSLAHIFVSSGRRPKETFAAGAARVSNGALSHITHSTAQQTMIVDSLVFTLLS